MSSWLELLTLILVNVSVERLHVRLKEYKLIWSEVSKKNTALNAVVISTLKVTLTQTITSEFITTLWISGLICKDRIKLGIAILLISGEEMTRYTYQRLKTYISET